LVIEKEFSQWMSKYFGMPIKTDRDLLKLAWSKAYPGATITEEKNVITAQYGPDKYCKFIFKQNTVLKYTNMDDHSPKIFRRNDFFTASYNDIFKPRIIWTPNSISG